MSKAKNQETTVRLRFSWRKEGYFQPDRRRLKGRNVLEYCQIMN